MSTETYEEMKVSDFEVGESVRLHPALDLWMMGERFGTVVKLGRKYVWVLGQRSGKTYRIRPGNLLK